MAGLASGWRLGAGKGDSGPLLLAKEGKGHYACDKRASDTPVAIALLAVASNLFSLNHRTPGLERQLETPAVVPCGTRSALRNVCTEGLKAPRDIPSGPRLSCLTLEAAAHAGPGRGLVPASGNGMRQKIAVRAIANGPSRRVPAGSR